MPALDRNLCAGRCGVGLASAAAAPGPRRSFVAGCNVLLPVARRGSNRCPMNEALNGRTTSVDAPADRAASDRPAFGLMCCTPYLSSRLCAIAKSLEIETTPAPILHATGQEFRQVETMRVLGVMFDSRGSTRTMVAFRLREAHKVWGRVRHLLVAHSLPVALRARRFYQTVVASATYGSGLWTPSKTLYNILEAQELRWLRALTCVRKLRGEEWVPFYRRRRAAAEALRAMTEPWTMWYRVCQAVHGLHGQWARHQDQPPAAALIWRGADWVGDQQALHEAGLFDESVWRHPHRGWLRTADTTIVNCLGSAWRTLATDRTAWAVTARHFLGFLCHQVGASIPTLRRRGAPGQPLRATRRRVA